MLRRCTKCDATATMNPAISFLIATNLVGIDSIREHFLLQLGEHIAQWRITLHLIVCCAFIPRLQL